MKRSLTKHTTLAYRFVYATYVTGDQLCVLFFLYTQYRCNCGAFVQSQFIASAPSPLYNLNDTTLTLSCGEDLNGADKECDAACASIGVWFNTNFNLGSYPPDSPNNPVRRSS